LSDAYSAHDACEDTRRDEPTHVHPTCVDCPTPTPIEPRCLRHAIQAAASHFARDAAVRWVLPMLMQKVAEYEAHRAAQAQQGRG
jgi:hypothetical protein